MFLFVLNLGGDTALNVFSSTPLSDGTASVTVFQSATAIPALLPDPNPSDFAFGLLDWEMAINTPGFVHLTVTLTAIENATGKPIRSVREIDYLNGNTSTFVFPSSPLSLSTTDFGPVLVATSVVATPSNVCAGDRVTLVVSVSNTGRCDAFNVSATVLAGSPGAALVSTPSPIAFLGAGQQATLTWSFLSVGVGSLEFTLTLQGNVGGVLGTTIYSMASTSNIVSERALTPGSVALTVSPTMTCHGAPVQLVMSFSNTGCTTLLNVSASATPIVSGSGRANVVSRPGTVSAMPPGAATIFIWSFQPSVSGTLWFTATLTAIDSGTSGTITIGPVVSSSIVISSPGRLFVTLSAPLLPALGDPIPLVVTVSNTGGTIVTGAVASATTLAQGTGQVKFIFGPIGGGPHDLLPGQSFTLEYFYAATGLGKVTFTASASGATVCNSLRVRSGRPRLVIDVSPKPNLISSFTTFPNPTEVGQTFNVTVRVANVGNGAASGVVPDPLLSFGSGVAIPVSPFTVSPVTLNAGSFVVFTWTYVGTVAGAVQFSTTVMALDPIRGTTILEGPLVSPAQVIITPASLVGMVGVSATSICGDGTPVVVALTVSNVGDVGARLTTFGVSTTPIVLSYPNLSVPTPPLPLVLAPHTATTFLESFTVQGPVIMRLTVSVSGVDLVNGFPVTTGPLTVPPVSVIGFGNLIIADNGVPPTLSPGEPISVTVIVQNNGTGDLIVTGDEQNASDRNGVLFPLTSPPTFVSIDLPAGASTLFVWTYPAPASGGALFNTVIAAIGCDGATMFVRSSSPTFVELPGGDWPMWGHDPANTFNQPGATSALQPPLEQVWATSHRAVGAVTSRGASYWMEYPGLTVRDALTGILQASVPGTFWPPEPAFDQKFGYLWTPQLDTTNFNQTFIQARDPSTLGVLFTFPVSTSSHFAVDDKYLYVLSNTTGTKVSPTYRAAIYPIVDSNPIAVATINAPIAAVLARPLVFNHQMVFLEESEVPFQRQTRQVWITSLTVGSATPFFVQICTNGNGYVPRINDQVDISPLMFDGQHVVLAVDRISTNPLLPHLYTAVVAYNLNGTLAWEARDDVTNANPGDGTGYYGLATNGSLVTASRGLPNTLSSRFDRFSVGSGALQDPSPLVPFAGPLDNNAIPIGTLVDTQIDTPLGGNFAFADDFLYPPTQSLYGLTTAIRQSDGKVVWTAGDARTKTPAEARRSALAYDHLYADGGVVYGPRTIDPPTNLVATPDWYTVNLSWSPAAPLAGSNPIIGYEIWRSSQAGIIWAAAATPGLVSSGPTLIATMIAPGPYTDTTVTGGLTYFYAVRAVRSGQPPSWFTDEQSATPSGLVAAITAPPPAQAFILGNHTPQRLFFTAFGYAALTPLAPPTFFSNWTLRLDGQLVAQSSNQQSTNAVLGSVIRSNPNIGTSTLVLRAAATDGHFVEASTSIYVFSSYQDYLTALTGPVWWSSPVFLSIHKHPEGISTDNKDFVYISDTLLNRVERVDELGNVLLDFGSTVTGGLGALKGPTASCEPADGNGQVYACDAGDNAIKVFDEDGRFLFTFGSEGTGDGQFKQPSGIAADGHGSVWVVDGGNNRLEQFALDGTFIKAVGTSGSAPGQFKSPTQITVDASGTLWVADAGNRRVQGLSPDGQVSMVLGAGGLSATAFNVPGGVVADTIHGNIYVSDSQNDDIAAFNRDGGFLGTGGHHGSALGQVSQPNGLAIDSRGMHLLIADTLNSRGQRWLVQGGPAVDTIPPRAELTAPAFATPIARGTTVAITGRAVDAYFQHYTIAVSGPDGTSTIVDSATPVWNGTLGQWNTASFSPGQYQVILTVTDQIGNVSGSEKTVFVFSPPVMLSGLETGKR